MGCVWIVLIENNLIIVNVWKGIMMMEEKIVKNVLFSVKVALKGLIIVESVVMYQEILIRNVNVDLEDLSRLLRIKYVGYVKRNVKAAKLVLETVLNAMTPPGKINLPVPVYPPPMKPINTLVKVIINIYKNLIICIIIIVIIILFRLSFWVVLEWRFL